MVDGHTNKIKRKTEAAGPYQPHPGVVCPSLSASDNLLEEMYRGYFPLWRKIIDWGWYKDGNTSRVFIHLLLIANFRESDFLGHRILRGQCVAGRKMLSAVLNISERQVRTAILHLKATHEVSLKVTSKFTIYTLNNFEKHLPENYNNLTKTTNRKSLKRPAIDQQSTTSNNDKNDKNDKNKRAFSPPSLKDIQEYIKEKNYNINPKTFYDYFTESSWVDSKGQKVRNWKQKIITWASHNQKSPQVKKQSGKI